MSRRHALAVTAVLLAAATPALAQSSKGDATFPACPSEQKIQQVMGSNGQFVPDDCRRLTITRIQSGDQEICVLDFQTGADPGFLTQLKSAAVPTQWWVDCAKLQPR